MPTNKHCQLVVNADGKIALVVHESKHMHDPINAIVDVLKLCMFSEEQIDLDSFEKARKEFYGDEAKDKSHKPIPCLCGGDKVEVSEDPPYGFRVYCPKCKTETGLHPTQKDAIETWNAGNKRSGDGK